MFDLLEYFGQFQSLSDAALTVRQQSRIEEIEQADKPERYYPIFFSRVDENSLKIAEITGQQVKPVAGRRGWNAEGTPIGFKLPTGKEYEICPVEAFHRFDEKRQQEILNEHNNVVEQALQKIKNDVPGISDTLADACLNRLEVDSRRAWLDGKIEVENTNGTGTIEVDLKQSSDAFKTYGSVWNATKDDPNNAYISFLDETIENARYRLGSMSGAIMEYRLWKLICDAARAQFEESWTSRAILERIRDELNSTGFSINTEIPEMELDFATTQGGAKTQKETFWSEGKYAYVPSDGQIGTVHHAPVLRAQKIAAQIDDDSIDIRGVTVFADEENKGKTLALQGQVNAIVLPHEERVYVVDTLYTG